MNTTTNTLPHKPRRRRAESMIELGLGIALLPYLSFVVVTSETAREALVPIILALVMAWMIRTVLRLALQKL